MVMTLDKQQKGCRMDFQLFQFHTATLVSCCICASESTWHDTTHLLCHSLHSYNQHHDASSRNQKMPHTAHCTYSKRYLVCYAMTQHNWTSQFSTFSSTGYKQLISMWCSY